MVGDISSNPYKTINAGDNQIKVIFSQLTKKVTVLLLHNRYRFRRLVVVTIRHIILLSFDKDARLSTKSKSKTLAYE